MNALWLELLVQWTPVAAVLVAALTFWAQQGRVVRSQRQETYTQLELASNEVFRFEAGAAEALAPYQSLLAPADLKASVAGEAAATALVFQTLNLFEIAVRMRRRGEIDPEVYGSWVIWKYSLLKTWWFRQLWPANRLNYTRDLRALFDEPVARFNPQMDEAARMQAFFAHVGKVMKCAVAARWLEN